jgi:hypothetical protein
MATLFYQLIHALVHTLAFINQKHKINNINSLFEVDGQFSILSEINRKFQLKIQIFSEEQYDKG